MASDFSGLAVAARRLRLLVWAVVAATLVVWAMLRLGVELGRLRIESTVSSETFARFVLDLALLLFVAALVQLAGMLGEVARGRLFAPSVTRRFRGFALGLLLSTLCQLAAQPLDALLLAARSGGRAALAFELSSLITMIGALLLFLIARMLERARAIETELESFV